MRDSAAIAEAPWPQPKESEDAIPVLVTIRNGAALLGALACVLALLLASAASAQTTDRALQKKQMAEVVDTTKFKKPGPYTIGVAAGYMSNSWVVFCLQHIRYEASLHKDMKDVIVDRRGLQSGQAGHRHRGPDRQERQPHHLLAGRREGDPAGAAEGGGQGHSDGQRRRRLHLLRRERCRTPSSTSGRSARRWHASSSRTSAARARSSRCCRSPAPRPRSTSSPR